MKNISLPIALATALLASGPLFAADLGLGLNASVKTDAKADAQAAGEQKKDEAASKVSDAADKTADKTDEAKTKVKHHGKKLKDGVTGAVGGVTDAVGNTNVQVDANAQAGAKK